jgi:pSer/pThr/pTyr-binding forkhead associated (FHA) protein
LWITDLESANGTFVNDKRLTAVERLKDGDKISIEKLRFVVKTPSKMTMHVAEDDDDAGMTVVVSVINSEAIKKAQAELMERKRLKDAELKMKSQQTLLSQAKLRAEAEDNSLNMMIIVIVAVVAIAVVVLI